MSDGVFIVIEGPDASGKETQWNRLVERLRAEGYDVFAQDFPAYEQTEAGRKLKEYLQSDDAINLTTEALAELYIEDRREMKNDLLQALNDGKVVVADRYSQSNYAYQTAHMSQAERWQFINWLKKQEADLPDPDVVLYIDTPVKQCFELMTLQGREKDRHEADSEYLRKVKAAYREIAEKEDWIRIDPMQHGWSWQHTEGTNAIRPPAEIHEDVWRAVQPVLP